MNKATHSDQSQGDSQSKGPQNKISDHFKALLAKERGDVPEETPRERHTTDDVVETAPEEVLRGTDETPAEVPEVVEDPVEEVAEVEAAEETPEGETPAVVAPAAETYKADTKYKAWGKEYDFDEVFTPVIKDKESEDRVRNLHVRAHAFDELKKRYDSTQSELSERSKADAGLEALNNDLQKRDFTSFFQRLKIPRSELEKWMTSELEFEQLPLEYRQQVQQQRDLQRQQQEAISRADTTEKRLAEAQMADVNREFALVSEFPEVKNFRSEFDKRAGENSFEREVFRLGDYYWGQGKGRLPMMTLAKEVMSLYGHTTPAAAPQAGGQGPSGSQTPPKAAAPKTKVLPNVSGRSASPVKQQIRSIADLRKLRKQDMTDRANRIG